jgi:hypothetical protein
MSDKLNSQLREIAEAEKWLAGHETPLPSSESLAAIRRAVRDELDAQASGRFPMNWKAWHGAVSAAAVVALCVGVAWRFSASTSPRSPGIEVAGANGNVLTWPDQTEEDVLVLADLEADLSDFEAWADEAAAVAAEDSLYQALEDALQQPAEPADSDQSTMRSGGAGINAAA